MNKSGRGSYLLFDKEKQSLKEPSMNDKFASATNSRFTKDKTTRVQICKESLARY